MGLKTVCLLGSPRRGGNSDTLARHFCERATSHGAEVEQFALSELSYRGCENNFRCKQDLNHCVQRDDLTPVLEAISQTQVLALTTPVYFTNISGVLKLAIDRFFSFFVPDYPTAENKSRLSSAQHLVFIQTQGEPKERYSDLHESYAASFNYLGFDQQHLIRSWGVREPDDVAANAEFLKQCNQVADKIYRS